MGRYALSSKFKIQILSWARFAAYEFSLLSEAASAGFLLFFSCISIFCQYGYIPPHVSVPAFCFARFLWFPFSFFRLSRCLFCMHTIRTHTHTALVYCSNPPWNPLCLSITCSSHGVLSEKVLTQQNTYGCIRCRMDFIKRKHRQEERSELAQPPSTNHTQHRGEFR